MSARFIIGIVALVCVSVCGIASSLGIFEMVDKVNERLPEEQQFAALGWYWPKYQTLEREYKKLYPDGNILRRVRILQVLMFASLFICFVAFEFFAR